MKNKKNIDIIEENSEAIEVETDKSLTLDELAFALADLTADHRKLVIKTAKRFARAYKDLEEIHDQMRRQNEIDAMENEL